MGKKQAKTLLFVDTNILLDFYRGRNDTALKLLKHLDAITDKVIVTFQLDMEFKKNRQKAILEGEKNLGSDLSVARPGLFSDTKSIKAAERAVKTANQKIKRIRERLMQALKDPTKKDPVYQICQRMFNKMDDLNLHRSHDLKNIIKRKAWKRFILGCPPRKNGDTSIGDAINWEWIVACAKAHNANVVIVTRDSDYGLLLGNETYINDHLKQEFSDRVNRQRKIIIYTKLSDALKNFKITITKEEEEAETEILGSAFFGNLKSTPKNINTNSYDSDAFVKALERLRLLLNPPDNSGEE